MANCCCDEQACCQSAKRSVRVATTGNLSATRVGNVLTANANGALTIDGITMAVDDRVLTKDQTTGADNGIYDVTAIGSASTAWSMTRSADFDQSCDLIPPVIVAVSEGSANADTEWMLTTNDDVTINSTSLTWKKFAEPGTVDIVIFSATASATVGNTATETTLIGAGTGSLTILANVLSNIGSLRLRSAGTVSTGAAPGTFRIRLYYGAVVIFDTTAIVLPANLAARTWELDVTVDVSPGSSGAMSSFGTFRFGQTALGPLVSIEGGLSVAVDTTANTALNLTAQWGAAATTETTTGQLVIFTRSV